jgi:hypothetical protein
VRELPFSSFPYWLGKNNPSQLTAKQSFLMCEGIAFLFGWGCGFNPALPTFTLVIVLKFIENLM